MAGEDHPDTGAEAALAAAAAASDGGDTGGQDPDRSSDPGAHDLGDPGKKALDAERAARRKAERDLAAAQARVKEFEDSQKSESERLQSAAQDAKSRADKAEAALLRRDLADELGITAKQARYLQGNTREELEASYTQMVEDGIFAPAKTGAPDSGAAPPSPERQPESGDTGRPPGRPTESLRGGGSDPTETPEETDPKKLAALVPRIR